MHSLQRIRRTERLKRRLINSNKKIGAWAWIKQKIKKILKLKN
tara:strand:- start:2 stop:130 length:129 start_codon:yes stop_codon:yes gene_type:complete